MYDMTHTSKEYSVGTLNWRQIVPPSRLSDRFIVTRKILKTYLLTSLLSRGPYTHWRQQAGGTV